MRRCGKSLKSGPSPLFFFCDNTDMMTVGDIGELALIERLASRVRAAGLNCPQGIEVVLGIGDDAAAWRVTGIEVATTDTMVEGMHFRPTTAGWDDIGWKCWVSNVSDVISMGASPLIGLVTLGLPSDLPIVAIDALYDGILDACAFYGTLVLGGDIVGSPIPFVTVAMTGRCDGAPLTRRGARVGDLVAVSGPLGASSGGLRLLEGGIPLHGPNREGLIRAHRRPNVRKDMGPVLRQKGVTSAMDISDGIAADMRKLAAASEVAASIDVSLVPIASELWAEFPADAVEMALGGGEDYELIFTGPATAVEAVIGEIPGPSIIGEIVSGESGEVYFHTAGVPVQMNTKGWEHLR